MVPCWLTGVTGFVTVDFNVSLAGACETPKDDAADRLPEEGDNEPTVTRRGDLWLLGDHKLLCGDTREPTSFVRLMGNEKARLVFSDPPYNVKIDGHVCGLGSVKHEEFACASGEMSEEEFVTFLATAFRNQAEVSLDGAIHFQCMDWRHIGEMLKAGHSVYSELKNLCVWTKDNGGMGSFYRSQHELVFVLEGRDRAACQHGRARKPRALPHQRLVLRRGEHAEEGPDGRARDASDREAGRDDQRRDQGLFEARRDRSRRLRRLGLDADRGRKVEAQGSARR